MSRNENYTSDSSHNEQDDLYGSDSHDGVVTPIAPVAQSGGYSTQDRVDSNDLYGSDSMTETGMEDTAPDTFVTSPIFTPTFTPATTTGQGAYGSYDFGIVNGQVTQVLKNEHGMLKNEHIDVNQAYTVQGSDIVKTENKAYGQEVTRYVDPEGDGLYAKFSEQFVPSNGAGTIATPVSTEPLYDRGGDGDDHLAVRATQDPALGGLGADSFVVRDWGHVTIGDFHHDQHDRLVFDTGLGVHSVGELAQRVTDLRWQGDDLVLDMGAAASVTLVGARINGIGLEDIDVLS